MNKYEVVSACYVPVGNGFRYKLSGQIVTLSDEQAAALAEHIRLVDPSRGVAKRNTEPEVVEQPVEQPFEQDSDEVFGGVVSDDDYPEADHE